MKRLSAFILVLVFCFTIIAPSAIAASSVRDTSLEEELATELKCLGLFKGVSDTDFALDRAPTRTEAVVLFIRALGKENEALSGNWSHPFTDVPSWADKYIGYAYENGLTNGISSTEFGTQSASSCMYLTFVLRSLGYKDYEGADFYWNAPYSLSRKLDLLPDRVHLTDFKRADAVTISYLALSAAIKGTSQSLADKLISAGAFSEEAFDTYYYAGSIDTAEAAGPLSAKEIYAKCSPAVFYIEVYNSKGNLSGTASGFFIDSKGTAVSNFHPFADAYSAKITTSDTKQTYNVLGLCAYDKDEDWAILKIDGTGFSYLDLDDSSSVIGGQDVYTIGSPLGMSNSISQGLIANSERQIEGYKTTFIQITAAISKGSSGGALINEYGKVIGITTATSTAGQNVNLALPINYIKGYSSGSVQTILSITVNPQSMLSAYAEYSDVPDCGAYYGISTFKVCSTVSGTTYYYTMNSLNAIGEKVSSIDYPDYLQVLADWGFTYMNEFLVGSSYYWQFNSQTSSTPYIILVGTTTIDNTNCLSVQVINA